MKELIDGTIRMVLEAMKDAKPDTMERLAHTLDSLTRTRDVYDRVN